MHQAADRQGAPSGRDSGLVGAGRAEQPQQHLDGALDRALPLVDDGCQDSGQAFDLILAESLWAEWRPSGVDVLGLVLSATDTPSLRRLLAAKGGSYGALADPVKVAEEALVHLADGPTWICGSGSPAGASPLGAMSRRDAVLAMSRGASASAKPGTE